MTIAIQDLDRDLSVVQELQPAGERSAYPRLWGLKQRLTRSCRRFETLARDRIRYSGATRRIFSMMVSQGERFRRPRDSNEIAQSVNSLAKAARVAHGFGDCAALESRMERLMSRWSAVDFHWDNFFLSDTATKSVGQAVILKKPQSHREKGVLFVSFEFQWIRLLRNANVDLLARDYDIVLSPTWSPPQDLAFSIAARMWPSKIFTILSNFDDLDTFQRICPKVCPIPLLASSWVNPDVVSVRNPAAPCRFDIAMLANFATYKRHAALFRALAEMDRSVRVLLLGVPWEGRTRHSLEDEAGLFGVRERVVIKEALPDREMFRELRSAKVSVILSRQEGSCVAVAESLFAGVPVGLLRAARIGSKAFINERTGRLLNESSLASDLTSFLEHYGEYRPREWALEAGISCRESSGVLNDHLKRAAVSSGRQWTVDIAPMHWRPYPRYLCDTDRISLQDEYDRFASTYGVGIKVPT